MFISDITNLPYCLLIIHNVPSYLESKVGGSNVLDFAFVYSEFRIGTH